MLHTNFDFGIHIAVAVAAGQHRAGPAVNTDDQPALVRVKRSSLLSTIDIVSVSSLKTTAVSPPF